MDKALEVASRINHPIPAALFALVIGSFVLARFRARKPLVAWLVFSLVLVLGLAPLASSTFIRTRGLYHIRVVVLSPDGQPTDEAKLTSSAGGEIKKAPGNWEYDLPPQSRPSDGVVTLTASVPDAYLLGHADVKLGGDYFPTATIQLAALPSVELRGVVVDPSGRSVAAASVSEVGFPTIVTTDRMGNFSLPGHGAAGQLVQLRAEKGALSTQVSAIAGKSIQLILR